MMTLEEAIKHCNEVACKHNKCAMEHKQLAEWLNELNELKKIEQKSAWSEEDENRFRNLIYLVEHSNEGKGTKEGFIKFINILKSLKYQNTWKPSEEQLEALEHFVRSIGESGYTSPYENNTKLLYSLLEQLKKLN